MASSIVVAALPAEGPAGAGVFVRLLRTVKPFIAVTAVIATGISLVVAIYFTQLDLAWIAFLGGVLFASILAMTTQATRAELSGAKIAEQLSLARYQLTGEVARREKLEARLATAAARLHFADDSLPVMLAFVDRETRYRYHNRAFRLGFGLEFDRIEGHHMRDVLGRKVFAEVESHVFEAAAGRAVRFERVHVSPTGEHRRLAVQYLPQFADDGNCNGFFVTLTDITATPDAGPTAAGAMPGRSAPAGWETVESSLTAPVALLAENDDATVVALESEWQYASKRILSAINGNEFVLFCQRITPLSGKPGAPEFFELLIRLPEEEHSLVPPGAFFALAEEHGLLPQLDRWVVTHLLEWMQGSVGVRMVRSGTICFINITSATIRDPEFADFVDYQLRRTGISGRSICFEIAEQDMSAHRDESVAFARAIRDCGCLIAISGFGRDSVPMETLKLFPVDFLKIDGSIVRQLLTYPIYLGKAVAISKLAKSIKVRTVAEMVEDTATLDILRRLNVDFAQGFGIALPQALADLTFPGSSAAGGAIPARA